MKMQCVRFGFVVTSIILLLAINVHGQKPVNKYDASWKKVEALVNKGLPKSALAEVKKIYSLAKKERQDGQMIKSLIYMTGLQESNREDNEMFSMDEIAKEINSSKEPVTSILNSLLASIYWNYYQQNRWKLYNRTQTINFKKDDIATWNAEDFHKKIGDLLLKSISNDNILKQTRLEPFDPIIIKGNVRHLRPTLFDLLAHAALNYFDNDERDIKKPAYSFEIDQAAAFDPAAEFVTRKFATKDSLSLKHKALLVYQRLIEFHLHDTRPDALIDVDLQRIEFVKGKSVHPDKDSLYLQAIQQVARKYDDHRAATQAWFLIASYYNEKAGEYKPYGDSTHRLDRIKAKEICEKILLQKDSSEGKINCFNLLNQIKGQSLKFSIENVNIPNQPFRALVEYRNLSMLHFRLIKPDEKLKKELEEIYSDGYWSSIIHSSALRNWDQALPASNDFQSHNTEIKIDALPAGDYLLVASSEKDPGSKKAILGARYFHVSSISFINNEEDYFVLNRDSGLPLPNAGVQVWERQYDYKTSKYINQKGPSFKTDANGFFKWAKSTKNKNDYSNHPYLLDISYNGERLFMNDPINEYYYYRDNTFEESKISTSAFFFTDRSIYRPGQTLYFKAIFLSRMGNEKSGSVRSDYETTLVLRNANGEDVDSLKLKTNEYGSVTGKFQLPETGLNGTFSITTRKDEGSTSFRVEEYKRPKFYVDYEPIKGSYRVNDKVKVTGVAKAYAGHNIDGATVKYRVVRKPRYIYFWMFWRGWQPPTEELEIAHGELQTDKEGKFVVEFTAIPDLKVDRKFEPVFDYTVYADVTDINGETRSGEKMISVSYKSLLLRVNIASALPVDSLRSISIRTENMNGEFEPARLQVLISRLKEEKRLIRDRFWERPDQFVMTREEYIAAFPHDEYDNETDPKAWEKVNRVFDRSDSARENGKWTLIGEKFEPGYYSIEVLTKDKDGQQVRDVKYIELYDEGSNKLPNPKYLWANDPSPIEPGEKTSVRLGTSADNLYVIHEVKKKAGPGEYSFVRMNQEKESFEFTATEADRGGYGAGWLFVKHNRFYKYIQTITVPWTNKELSIEYATYRDKTLPGSEEKWKLKIKGYKNEKLAAEMLATMYDASLDQFYPHQFSAPFFWPTYYNYGTWNSAQNFASVESNEKAPEYIEQKFVNKVYDQIISFVSQDMMNQEVMAKKELTLSSEVNFSPGAADKLANRNLKDGLSDSSRDSRSEQIKTSKPPTEIQIRKNFNETAFFLPSLRTDSTGAIEFTFTIPEALTKWKFQALAHTKDAAFGYSSKEIITQKQLMVQPNAPRFLREGDRMEFSAKIVNLTDKELTGTASLELFDATTNKVADGLFKNSKPTQQFTIAAGQSEPVRFPMEIPYQFNKALVWRIVAKAKLPATPEEFSDGEEAALAVLTNRMLVTETLPLVMKGTGTKDLSFDKLLNSGSSKTLQNQSLTIEYTSNPAWYAVQALPYLMEFPYECAEQLWNRYYANSLATRIANSTPRIKAIFDQWSKTTSSGNNTEGALISNLQKNQELKSILLEETPWVLQAKNETEQKKNIALLFDLIRMSKELNSAYDKLKQMQSSNGGFVWFSGGPDDRYITQYIVTGIGHLKKLQGYASGQDEKLKQILASAIPYLDGKIKEDYDFLIKHKVVLKNNNIDFTQIQYLYMRSFFPELPISKNAQTAYNYYYKQLQQFWTKKSKYMQGMAALALGRTGDKKTSAAILKSLKETSITNEELGMYWKDIKRGWFWHEAPIETQSLLIEAFNEIGKDKKTVDDLKTWLLKNKQTNNWETTRATAEACYALLLQGTDLLSQQASAEIKLGATSVSGKDQLNDVEAGTGYFKKSIESEKITPAMGKVSVSIQSSNAQDSTMTGVSWGAVYWQYFEDLDKITTSVTPLKLTKQLFIEKNTDRGPVITPVNNGDRLRVGDKIKVRIELRVDRDMEYIHMKDMRASCMEPVNVLSSYKWQGGLGYYETTRDASTNFFFSSLRKGTYVFEYPLFITHQGDFSNGIASIQCMYAPEFSSHSEGIRITID